MPDYTAAQRAAFSFAVLARHDDRWRTINRRRLSFTEPGWSPLGQLYGSVADGLIKLYVLPGDVAGLGFAALNAQDAEQLRQAWIWLLTPDDDDPDSPAPPPRKELP